MFMNHVSSFACNAGVDIRGIKFSNLVILSNIINCIQNIY